MSDSIRIIVADDHELFRRGLVEILREQPDFVLAGEASSGPEAVRLYRERQAHIALMDVHMPQGDGIEAVRQLKAQAGAKVLMLTVSDKDQDLIAALQAGADGYLLKNTRPQELCQAIRQVVAGHGALSPEVVPTVMRAAAHSRPSTSGVRLSAREYEVLTLLAQGATTYQIAAALVISENTVKTYVNRILKKLKAANRAEAVARAASLGLLHRTR